MKDKTLNLILVGILFVMIIMAAAYYHEKAHAEIYRMFGMKNISIHLTWEGMETRASGTCNDSCKLAQSNNESVGYNLNGVMMGIFLLICTLIMLKEDE